MLQKIFRYIFWTGYITVFVTTFIPVAGSLNKVKLGPENFQIQLDHLLHFAVYFLICMYYLGGQRKGLFLFNASPIVKFILLLLFLALVTELVQFWVPERTFNPMDLIANITGIIIGLIIIKIFGV